MKLNRKWLPVFVFGIFLYLVTYAYLRCEDTFIRRAGKYDFCWHFIEPAKGREGNQLFAFTVANLIQPVSKELSEEELDQQLNKVLEEEQFEQELFRLAAESEAKMKNRRLVFHLFRPIAFVEALIWHIVDPNPLHK